MWLDDRDNLIIGTSQSVLKNLQVILASTDVGNCGVIDKSRCVDPWKALGTLRLGN